MLHDKHERARSGPRGVGGMSEKVLIIKETKAMDIGGQIVFQRPIK